MYVKIFESHKSSNYYIIEHFISIKGIKHDTLILKNQEKKSIQINENELFRVINNYFKEKLK